MSYLPAEIASGEYQQIGGESAFDQAARRFVIVAGDGQNLRHASRASHLRGQRPGIGIANLKELRLLACFDDLIAGGQDRHARLATDAHALTARHRQRRDFREFYAATRLEQNVSVFGFASLGAM